MMFKFYLIYYCDLLDGMLCLLSQCIQLLVQCWQGTWNARILISNSGHMHIYRIIDGVLVTVTGKKHAYSTTISMSLYILYSCWVENVENVEELETRIVKLVVLCDVTICIRGTILWQPDSFPLHSDSRSHERQPRVLPTTHRPYGFRVPVSI